MKKVLSILSAALAIVLMLGVLAGCATTGDTPDDGNNDDKTTTTSVTKVTTVRTVEEIPDDGDDDDDDDIDTYAFPNAHAGELALEGYDTWGEFDNGAATGASMFIVTNDSMSAGSLTAKFTGVTGSPSDSGIVFCVEEDVNEDIFYWENGPAYYMLFASDGCTLYLAKVSYNGQPWNALQTAAIPGFQHGDEITITAEFDGEGNIKGYANGELLIEYNDPSPIEGSGYGVRAEIRDVTYSEISAIHD